MELKFAFFAAVAISAGCAFAGAAGGGTRYGLDDYRNYYGSWAATSPKESLQFAKNMGYRYVLYMPGMENFRESDGLWFVFETPEYMTYSRTIDARKKILPKADCRMGGDLRDKGRLPSVPGQYCDRLVLGHLGGRHFRR